jgi:hypothetical protein
MEYHCRLKYDAGYCEVIWGGGRQDFGRTSYLRFQGKMEVVKFVSNYITSHTIDRIFSRYHEDLMI